MTPTRQCFIIMPDYLTSFLLGAILGEATVIAGIIVAALLLY